MCTAGCRCGIFPVFHDKGSEDAFGDDISFFDGNVGFREACDGVHP